MKTLQQQQQQTNLMTFISSNANIRILLAEDNLVNQLLIKKVIEKAGYILELATNGLQVLEKLSHSQYDLILMDVQMPDMNGLETT